MAKHSVGLAITGDVLRRHRHHLTGDGRNQLIAHIDAIEESNAPAPIPPFDPIEEARITRELCFDTADFSRNINDRWQRCHSALAVYTHHWRSDTMSSLHAATRHVDRSLDKGVGIAVDPAQSNTSIRMKAVRHAVPPSVVAAFALAQNKLSDAQNS